MEEWRAIKDFHEYEISNLGIIRRSVDSHNGYKAGRIRRQSWAGEYRMVILCKNGKQKGFTVHSLVLEAFVGPRPPGHFANHKNGVKTDNYPKNLEWITPSESNRHAFRMGLSSNRGENGPSGKLKAREVWLIRKLLAKRNHTQIKIGKIFNVSHQSISDIKTGRTWNHNK